jgi:hypothetical protein
VPNGIANQCCAALDAAAYMWHVYCILCALRTAHHTNASCLIHMNHPFQPLLTSCALTAQESDSPLFTFHVTRCVLAACSILGQKLTCRLGDIPQGSSVSVVLRVLSNSLPRGATTTDVVNTVTASCTAPASCSGSGSATVQVRAVTSCKALVTYTAEARKPA